MCMQSCDYINVVNKSIYARINVQVQTYSFITASSQKPVVRHVYVPMLYTGGTIGMKGKGIYAYNNYNR